MQPGNDSPFSPTGCDRPGRDPVPNPDAAGSRVGNTNPDHLPASPSPEAVESAHALRVHDVTDGGRGITSPLKLFKRFRGPPGTCRRTGKAAEVARARADTDGFRFADPRTGYAPRSHGWHRDRMTTA